MVSLQNRVQATDFLFVQTASGATLNGTLTLTGVAEDVTYFSDRPERVAGRMSTEEFMTLFEPGGTFSEVYIRANCTCVMHSYIVSHVFMFLRRRERETENVNWRVSYIYMYVYACARVCCVHISIALCGQDPPNGALECKVDGVARTTVVTITTPVLMTDESGVVTLKYDAALVRMTRGGPTAANMTAATEDVADEMLVCDDNSSVSLFIDDAPGGCPSPMTSCPSLEYIGVLPPDPDKPPKQVCFPTASGATFTCATGFTLETGLPPQRNPYCASY